MIKKQFYMGFAGFLGLMSIRYFYSGNLLDLSYLGFFAFFANFIISKISGSKEDERYIEDKKAALAFIGQFAIIELFIIWCATMIMRNIDFICVLLSLAYAITLNAYAVKLYILEEK
ncbi:DUF3796 domain-containing protein [Clostridium sporogenes]|uniref:DUF3796 domain-containing protein n=1 Tax=Clostridium sporogenes TaxID=1509 RepID=UPI0013D2462B|nr:DUF3796 domain-containing protein [Clostridium sporogenes]MDU6337101.1 DUF3796 domain-containing protein [Clostridium sporogenes]NFF66810.1 DUF3796 domain-containing protein [Clostridium sporogenes]NFF99370.1 DUF3796 domain-containing protein [Clostridium sporogenes]NFG06878.1 DUF3796 domain-containing protein [Clostridium sporogenes]NFG51428.1 DUF3796 domain-containing protein [Clostridium sporogenes]